ncbi:BTAD domain-containing putative transcriptional regulator [Saccharopolyspora spinosporotrichia]|uniref:BTAD domain-containing putative transcriptional regulator n=1 Tax=Saccharopolyspora erythraea TaxID=1836 RepID=A0ABN1DIE7_SACER
MAVLGPFRLCAADGHPIDVGGARVRMLLARLALDAGRTVATETLIDDLWGANQPSGALNALQSLVSRARRALPDDLVLQSAATGYALKADAADVDAHRFARLAADGRGLRRDGRFAAAARTLREALRLWRGGALVDFVDAPFAAAQAARLEELRLGALEDRIDADLRAGRDGEPVELVELVAELDGLCARHPLRERFTGLRMRALYSAGRQADALGAYEALRRRLADELGVDPSQELRDLHGAVLRGEPREHRDRPPVLPSRLSSFVGREAEIEQVRTAMARSKLVTLFGPGGAGKTRLATETAAGVDDRRVWFVELASVRQGEDLPSAVLASVGVRETRLLDTAPADAMTRLVDGLSGAPALLVLDNCEHVIGAAAQFVQDLLTWCPQLGVLATSREPLALTGEELLPVGPLGLPDGEAPLEADAVRLFADRARSARPGFVLDDATIGDVVEVCRRLDGMPLAIELAAARLRAMSVRQVAARLDDRFRLLTSGNRASLARHRTLRAVVEWSWDLLGEPERLLARRLSVFAGPARAESAAAVCSDARLPAEDVFYVLSSLVEKSFVEAVDGDRYRMLETVRAYCDDRLAESGERDRVRTAHAEHFVELAETASPRLHRVEQVEWLERLDADHDNLMTALRWAISSQNADLGVRMGAALAWYWSMSAHGELASRLEALTPIPGDAPSEGRAVLEFIQAMLCQTTSWTERIGAAAARLRDTGAGRRYLYVTIMEPMAWMFVGDRAEMDAAVRRNLEHPDPWGRAAALFSRAFGAEHGGDAAGGEEHMRAAARAFREQGDRWGIAQSMGSLAGFRSLRGDHAGAIEALEESAETLRELRSDEEVAPTMVRIGMEHVRAGDIAEGRRCLEQADELAAASFAEFARLGSLTALGEAARRAGDVERARAYFAQARELLAGTPMAPPPLHQVALATEARVDIDELRLDDARARLRESLDSSGEIPMMPTIAMIAEQTALLRFAAGDHRQASYLLGVAVALRGMLDEGDPDIRAVLPALDAPDLRSERDRGAALTHEAALAVLREVLGPRG